MGQQPTSAHPHLERHLKVFTSPLVHPHVEAAQGGEETPAYHEPSPRHRGSAGCGEGKDSYGEIVQVIHFKFSSLN